MFEEKQANAEKIRKEQQKQRRERAIQRLNQKLSQHKQACRCHFGICNGTFFPNELMKHQVCLPY